MARRKAEGINYGATSGKYYDLVDYFDVLGNEEDGWEVNNQTVEADDIFISDDTTDEELLDYLKGIRYFNQDVKLSDIYIDWGDGDFIEIFKADDMMPICSLRLNEYSKLDYNESYVREERYYDLTPQKKDSRKSFYGKAKVVDKGNGEYELISYNTPVACVKDGKVVYADLRKYSATTDRHIREFLAQFCDECNESYVREGRNELHHYFDDLDERFAFDLDDEFEIYVGNKLVPCKVVDSKVFNNGEGLTYTIVTAIDGDDAHWQMDDWVQRGLDEFFREETDGSDYAYGLWETTDELYDNGDYPENGENTRWYVTDVDVYPVISDYDEYYGEGCGSRKKSKKKKIVNQGCSSKEGCGSKKVTDESAGVPSESQFVNAYTWSYGTTKAKAKQVYKDCKKDGDIEYIKAIVDGFEGNAKKSFYNDSKKPKKITKESGKKKYTQKDIKDYVDKGMATDITHYSFDEANKFYQDHNYDVVGVSHGTYGMNGALLQDVDTGEYYAITARNSTLFQLV